MATTHKGCCQFRQLTAEEEQELKVRFELLVYEGRQVNGTSPEFDVNIRPSYFGEERFARAQKTVNKYYTSATMASSVGLMLLLQLDEILIPLLKTGKSRTVPDLYERYMATAKYIKSAYESHFMQTDSEGWRYISLVRAMHRRAHELLNSPACQELKKPACRANEDGKYLWINQYDMALTQYAFIGLFVVRPDKCGAYHINESELSDIVHYWRLMSHQFGIEERFNLFVYDDDMAKEHAYMTMLLEHYKLKLAQNRSSLGLDMSRGFLLAFENLTTESTFNIIANHWHDVISMTGQQELVPYESLSERWKLARFTVIIKWLFRSPKVVHFMNGVYKKKFEKFCKEGEKIKKKLAKKYPNQVYELGEDQRVAIKVVT